MALYLKRATKISSWGSGAKPVFRGSVQVQNESWTDEGSGVYSLTVSGVKWLQIDGHEAKFASTDWIDIVDLPSSTTVEVDPSDLTGLDVIGAWVSSWNRPYSRSRGHLVTGYSNGVLTIRRPHGSWDRTWHTAAGADVAGKDGRLKLYGLSSYIIDDYDWAYEGGKLYVKLPSAPSNFVIRAVKEDAAIKIKHASVDIDGVELTDFFRAGVTMGQQADRATVQNCYIHHNREDGVRITDRNNSVQIIDNEIAYCDVRGISLANIENSKHNRNHIHHIGLGVNDGWMRDATDTRFQALMAITQAGGLHLDNEVVNSIEINDNHIHDTAWHGIHCTKASGKILRNRIHDVIQLLDDGGGIYLAWGLWDYPTAQYGLEVAYNRISGITEGFVNGGRRHCIYEDNGSGPNEIHHNVMWDYKGTTIYGAHLANVGSSFQNWHHNIIITKKGHAARHHFNDNGTQQGIQAQGVEIFDNVFICLSPDYECIRIDGNAFVSGGGSDRNYFINPYSTDRVAYNDKGITAWRSTYSTDANSTVKSNWLTYVDEETAENTHIKLYTNDTDEDVSQLIPAGYEDIDGNDVGGQTLTVPAHYGLVVLKSAN